MSKAASMLMAGVTGRVPTGHDDKGNIIYEDVVYQERPAPTFVKRPWVPSWLFRLLIKPDNEQ